MCLALGTKVAPYLIVLFFEADNFPRFCLSLNCFCGERERERERVLGKVFFRVLQSYPSC